MSRLNSNAMAFIPGQSFTPGLNRSSAVRTMQKTYRGNKSRRALTKKKQAASKIQSRLRGNRSRTGKSKQWGLPYPDSKRDLDFDPKLQRRIMGESIYGIRDGLQSVRDSIESRGVRVKGYEQKLSKIKEEKENEKGMYNLGRLADEEKKDRYYKYTADNIIEIMADMGKNPDWRDDQELYEYKQLYGQTPGVYNLRETLKERYEAPFNTDYEWLLTKDNPLPGLTNEDAGLAKIEDDQQRYYQDLNKTEKLFSDKKKYEEFEQDFEGKNLDDLEKLDIFKCKDIKAMAQADERLFLDQDFMDRYIRPCRDQLTQIYIDTFYSVPFQVIMPLSISIEKMLKGMVKNGNFSTGVASAMTDTLITAGIMSDWGRVGGNDTVDQPFTDWLMLSQFYRFASPGARTELRHLPRRVTWPHTPFIVGVITDENRGRIDISGREALEYTLELFEDTIRARKLKRGRALMTDDDIEKMKRYFILCLIGFKSPVGGESESNNYLGKLTGKIENETTHAKLYAATNDNPDGEEKVRMLKQNALVDKLELIRFNLDKYGS